MPEAATGDKPKNTDPGQNAESVGVGKPTQQTEYLASSARTSLPDAVPNSIPKPRKRWAWGALASLVGLAIAISLIAPMRAPARTFVALATTAMALIIGGLITLILLIPAAAASVADVKEANVKTEFYSARAAYLCVLGGLILLGIVVIGAVFARVVLTVGRS